MRARIGLVGFGVGGRLFHAPYIEASAECELAGIVARSPERVRLAATHCPGVPVYGSLGELIDAGVDAVTITTPPQTRRELVLEAVERGVAVVADKPFALSADDALTLISAAHAAGVLLNVFHNRRFDADIVTARGVLDSGALGAIQRLDLRCDQDDPDALDDSPDGGLLRDLGSHVVDQALSLLGPARAVSASLDWADTPAGPVDTGYVLHIHHRSGAHSHLSSTKRSRLSSRELRLIGRNGSYISDYSDVQYDAIVRGERPGAQRSWGVEDESRWGRIRLLDGTDLAVPSARGDYTTFYDRFARAWATGDAGPVPAEQGLAVLEVIDAAFQSSREGATVDVIPSETN
ncbi:Gfo/Idh/MocA family protein [Microbacterium atlanticum]|uniref:Gfo/Idh/MocA family protein n=1 Tax=Microbacterium atlanticum TaxID=2782168 RepID=UPI0018899AFB|nr:Gfo/Idh/MocA family oxidoreductase [Microbacterium atlanticum]